MSEQDAVAVDRRGFLKRSAVAAAIGGGAVATTAFSGVALAQTGQRMKFAFDVVADVDKLDVVETKPGEGPFYIPGKMYESGADTETAKPIGRFQCWGWFADGGNLGVVSQEFNFFGQGKLQVQGIEDGGQRAVVGGTGVFRHASGVLTFPMGLDEFPFFMVKANLIV